MIPLPPRYRILPASVRFSIPGFGRSIPPQMRTLAPQRLDCERWFASFAETLNAAVGRRYLPVCRMSDGEFGMLLGQQPPSPREPLGRWARGWARHLVQELRGGGDFQANTMPGVPSARYSQQEALQARARYGQQLRLLSERGVLAPHLSYGERPFQERFFPALGRWLRQERVTLTADNYAPFYFVYALLSGPRRVPLLSGRRVLAVHGARGEKRQAIVRGLERQGVARVHWCPISSSRSLFDRLDVGGFTGRVDLALVGAGVGKPNVLLQLEPLGVPAIDAGYMFEVWADPENRWQRAMCVTDQEYDPRRVQFLPRPDPGILAWRRRRPALASRRAES